MPPIIKITDPEIKENLALKAISDYNITIRGVALDDSSIAWVKINGKEANLDADGSFWISANLAIGKNSFEIQAMDLQNNIEKRSIIIERVPVRVTSKEHRSFPKQSVSDNFYFGEYHALVIGNNNYKKLPKLNTAVNDAKTIASVPQDQYGFKIKLILNGTRRDILPALDKLRGKLTQKDNLLIFYAGHGYFDKDADRGYWLPIDASDDTSVDWISNADITDKLKAFKAKHVMVVADSCYSGTLTRGLSIKLRSPKYLMKISQKRARTVLTSGGLEPVADSGSGGHSVFAIAFLNALRENTEIMDGTQLFSKIRRPVMVNAPQTPQYSDIRFAGHDGGDFLFVRKKK